MCNQNLVISIGLVRGSLSVMFIPPTNCAKSFDALDQRCLNLNPKTKKTSFSLIDSLRGFGYGVSDYIRFVIDEVDKIVV